MTVTFLREIQLKYRGPRRGTSFDPVTSPGAAADFMRRVCPDNVREHFLTLFLDGANHVVGYYVAATGTASSCPVGAREVFQAAILAGATSIIIGHNHPSGTANPSQEDRTVTQRLSEAGTLVGIPVLDHLIVGSACFYSFCDHGEIPARKQVTAGAAG
jgi:DNA repair protein RadC